MDEDVLAKELEKQLSCNHGLTFDSSKITNDMSGFDVKKMFPRLCGECPLGCGYNGIAYVSAEHYIFEDW